MSDIQCGAYDIVNIQCKGGGGNQEKSPKTLKIKKRKDLEGRKERS